MKRQRQHTKVFESSGLSRVLSISDDSDNGSEGCRAISCDGLLINSYNNVYINRIQWEKYDIMKVFAVLTIT